MSDIKMKKINKLHFQLSACHYFKLRIILQVITTLLHIIGESYQSDYSVLFTPSDTFEKMTYLLHLTAITLSYNPCHIYFIFSYHTSHAL